MEKHVTSLELSKKLKELGFAQTSVFEWVEHSNGNTAIEIRGESKRLESDYNKMQDGQRYSAYLASELGEWLPKWIQIRGNGYDLAIDTFQLRWRYYYNARNLDGLEEQSLYFDDKIYHENEADARATLLIWLVENGHLEV